MMTSILNISSSVKYSYLIWSNLNLVNLENICFTRFENVNDHCKTYLSLSFRAGLVAADLPLNFTKYLGVEVEYMPWFTAQKAFVEYEKIFSTTRYYGQFRVSLCL
jgi:hypothetical protein